MDLTGRSLSYIRRWRVEGISVNYAIYLWAVVTPSSFLRDWLGAAVIREQTY